MNLPEIIKTPLRPLYKKIRKKIGIKTEYDNQVCLLEAAYTTFIELSGKNDIKAIAFENGKCIFTLIDSRQYYYDPFNSVASMYSVPHVGTFENKETDYLRNIVKKGQICIDVGGNFGWYTILLSNLVGNEGMVHSFEPLPHTFDVLKNNVSLNQARNVRLNQVALDESVGQKTLFLSDIGVSGSFKLHEYDKTYSTYVCPTDTLDDYCKNQSLEYVDFIKADIEGAELMMLKGGYDTISRYKPTLFLEIQEHSTSLFGYKPKDIFNWLYDLGYRAFYINNNSEPVAVADYRHELPDYNFFFINE